MPEIKSELQLQAACHTWLWNSRPDLRGLFWMNHNDGKKSIVTGAQDRARGLVKGVPDWGLMVPRVLPWPHSPHHGLFVEFKFGTGTVSLEQAAIITKLRAQGFRVQVVRTVEDFKELIAEHLTPID